jgi:hypothetical protein
MVRAPLADWSTLIEMTSLGGTIMQHTLVAVFDNRSDAQNALDELLASGFTRTNVNLSSADPTGMTDSVTGAREDIGSGVHEEGIGASIKHFFTNLFGADNDAHVSRYSDAVTRGHHVVTLTTESEPEVERAADIIERFGPVDIDERHDLSGPASTLGAATLGTGTMAGAMSASTAGMQQSTSYSAQSATPGSGGLNQSNVDNRPLNAPGSLQNAQSASMQRDEDDLPFPAKQDLNDDVPRGTTYQESMGNSQADFLQGTASMQGSNDMSLGGTASVQGGSAGQSLQRGSTAFDSSNDLSRDRVRVYSRAGETAAVDLGGLDEDTYYRSDWDKNYSSLGGSYDDYAPAYRYGSESRGKYSGRAWDDVESDLRSDWDSRYASNGGPSTWEKFKAAVKRGWDKITPDMNDDDDYYRGHWTSTYGSSADTYNDYQPAYRYGNEMRRSSKYTGRNWNDVEGDLQTDWDSRYGKAGEPSTWEKMKSAVRHGWDRMTS